MNYEEIKTKIEGLARAAPKLTDYESAKAYASRAIVGIDSSYCPNRWLAMSICKLQNHAWPYHDESTVTAAHMKKGCTYAEIDTRYDKWQQEINDLASTAPSQNSFRAVVRWADGQYERMSDSLKGCNLSPIRWLAVTASLMSNQKLGKPGMTNGLYMRAELEYLHGNRIKWPEGKKTVTIEPPLTD